MERQPMINNTPGLFPAMGRKPIPSRPVITAALVPDPDLSVPPRGGEARSIGQLMEPLKRIIAHPDRNRIMAKFFRDNW